MLDGLSRFVRAWLVALVVAFIATNVAHRWLGLPVHSILGVDPTMRFGFLWQWFTHPWVELPSGFELIGFLIVLFVVYSTLPRLETTRGRRTVMTVMAAGTVAPGVVALALAYLFPTSLKLPVCGFWAPLFALWAYEAYMLRGVTGLRVSPLGAGPGIPMSGEQLLGMLVAFAVLRLILNVLPIHFAADLASIAAGVGVAWSRKSGGGRPTTPRRKSPPGIRVVRGGDDHKVFHRSIRARRSVMRCLRALISPFSVEASSLGVRLRASWERRVRISRRGPPMNFRLVTAFSMLALFATGCVVDNPAAYDRCATVKDCTGLDADLCLTVTQNWGAAYGGTVSDAICTTDCTDDFDCSRSANGRLGFCSLTEILGQFAGTCYERCYYSSDCSPGFVCAGDKDVFNLAIGEQICVPAPNTTPPPAEPYATCGSVSDCGPQQTRCESIDPKWNGYPNDNLALSICTQACATDGNCPISYNGESGYCAPGGEISSMQVCVERCDDHADCLTGFRCAQMNEIAGLPNSTDSICVPDPF